MIPNFAELELEMRTSSESPKIELSPMQWSELRDIDDVEPVGQADALCLADLRDVLSRHGKLDRFGVMLLHTHFSIAEDEVLLERSDNDRRRLSIEVVATANTGRSVQTHFRFLPDGAQATTWCNQQCAVDIHGNHYANGHRTV